MTYTKKQILPALHNSSKVSNPDLNEIGEKNYTSTILRYAGLAVKFAQLDTKAKTIVPAINEVRVIPNPPLEDVYYITTEDGYVLTTDDNDIILGEGGGGGTAPALNTVKINGTIYKIEGGGGATSLDELSDVDVENPTNGQALVYDEATGLWVNSDAGGGDYTAGYGIYFTGENNSVINADAGRFSPAYDYFRFSSDYGPVDGGDTWEPCWEDSGTTVEGHTVYQTNGGTYLESSGNSVCTFTVGGYDRFTIYAKQNPATSGFRYVVFGYMNSQIDLENRNYARSCQSYDDSDYIDYTYYLGGSECTVQLMYHKEPVEHYETLELNDGQFVDTGTTVDDHIVYKSDAGSYHVDYGSSVCTLSFAGITSLTIYFRSSSESGYDWAYVGGLDQEVSTYYYKSRMSGDSGYTAVTYECTAEPHYIQIMYKKDGSVNAYDDRAYFYYVVNEYVPVPTDDDRAFAYIVLGDPIQPQGEVFNDYTNNRALGGNSHAEGSNTKAFGYATHAEGISNKAIGSYSHAEGIDNEVYGSSAHVEGGQNKVYAEKSHAEGMDNVVEGAYAHAEGAYNTARGERSHVEGLNNIAEGPNSHAEGRETHAIGYRAHTEGYGSIAQGTTTHAEGWRTQAQNGQDHAEGYYSIASGGTSHAEGMETKASGADSHSEGDRTEAQGHGAHAEGVETVASGYGSHAEGYGDSNNKVTATGYGSHAEGGYTSATADFAHAEGRFTIASGAGSHAEGFGGYGGQYNTATGIASHAEGSGNLVSGNCGHAEGTRNNVYSESGHAEGSGNNIYGHEAHIEGSGNRGTEYSSHTEGAGNSNISFTAHVEGAGNKNTSISRISHTEGAGNTNYGHQSHIEGSGNKISGEESHLEGAGNILHGAKTHGEGGGNIAYAFGSHIEGKHNVAIGYAHHIEGADNRVGYATTPGHFSYGTTYAIGDIVSTNASYYNIAYPEPDTHFVFKCIMAPGQIQSGNGIRIVNPSEWDSSTSYGYGDVVRVSSCGFYYSSSSSPSGNPALCKNGWQKITNILSPFISSSSYYSGYYLLDSEDIYGANAIAIVDANVTTPVMWEPVATSLVAHVEGVGNISTGDYQHIQGKYNVADANKAFIIGNGTADNVRSNALTVDWSGNLAIAGDLTAGIPLSTTAQTVGAAINEIVAGGGGGGSVTPIPDSFIYSLFS